MNTDLPAREAAARGIFAPTLERELKVPETSWQHRLVMAAVFVCIVAFACLAAALLLAGLAKAHEWYPPQCCSGHDCRAIKMEDVQVTPHGFFIEESRELIAFADPRIRKTPPEGRALYHRCSQGGKPEGETICLYIPNWTG